MKTYIIKLSDEEAKACLSEMENVQLWIENTIFNKARKVMDRIVEGYFDGRIDEETPFTEEEKAQIKAAVGDRKVLTPGKIKKLSKEIKKLMVKRVQLSTPAQRLAKEKEKPE